jgi:hypothetical protein
MPDRPLSAAWYAPDANDRRAGLRYRCVYPIQALCNLGVHAELFDARRDAGYDVVAFDAWTLFPTVGGTTGASQAVTLAQSLKARGTRVLLDNCDNQFAGKPTAAWRQACEHVRTLARLADHVVTCSEELAAVMQAECGLGTLPTVIGDPVEERITYRSDHWLRALVSPARKASWWRYLQHRQRIGAERARGVTPLVWFGSHGNAFADAGMTDLARLLPLLAQLNAEHPLSLTVISNHRGKFDAHFGGQTFASHYLDWDRITFLASLRLHDIALLPITHNDFTRCKSANRLTLALHHGLNVVADGIPSYREFQGCTFLDDWPGGLRAYLGSPELRRRHREAGRVLAQARYALPHVAQQWKQALQAALAPAEALP